MSLPTGVLSGVLPLRRDEQSVCMGVHRKEQKLKEAVRLRGVNTLLTKERGFGLQGTTNYGKGTRKYVGGTHGK